MDEWGAGVKCAVTSAPVPRQWHPNQLGVHGLRLRFFRLQVRCKNKTSRLRRHTTHEREIPVHREFIHEVAYAWFMSSTHNHRALSRASGIGTLKTHFKIYKQIDPPWSLCADLVFPVLPKTTCASTAYSYSDAHLWLRASLEVHTRCRPPRMEPGMAFSRLQPSTAFEPRIRVDQRK